MVTEGFLAVIVILACVAGLGLGFTVKQDWAAIGIAKVIYQSDGETRWVEYGDGYAEVWNGKPPERYSALTRQTTSATEPTVIDGSIVLGPDRLFASGEASGYTLASQAALIGPVAFQSRYQSWSAASGFANTISAFVDGSANFLKSIGIPGGVAVALMGVFVASFAGTTLDTACRLQRYVVQELAATFLPAHAPGSCAQCGYDLRGTPSGVCPECGHEHGAADADTLLFGSRLNGNPLTWLRNKHGATIFAVAIAFAIAAMPAPGSAWTLDNAGKDGMILWPMFGATNQLLGGLAFLVIAFYLRRRRMPVWFLIPPLLFMLIMPAWAIGVLLSEWWTAEARNWPLIVMGAATLALEAWMIVEAVLLWPRVRGILETALPPEGVGAETEPA